MSVEYCSNKINTEGITDFFNAIKEITKTSDYIDDDGTVYQEMNRRYKSVVNNIDLELFKDIFTIFYDVYQETKLIMWNVSLSNVYATKNGNIQIIINGCMYTEPCKLGEGDINKFYDCIFDEYCRITNEVYIPRYDMYCLDHMESI